MSALKTKSNGNIFLMVNFIDLNIRTEGRNSPEASNFKFEGNFIIL
jgi:hypothetical protein